MSEQIVVAMGMPCRTMPDKYRVHGIASTASLNEKVRIEVACSATSLLPLTFNTLWAGALDARQTLGVTHFAMIHDDILPDEPGWLDILLEELDKTKADIVSAVVPIKDTRGLTSTGIDTECEWNPRRLTLHDVYKLPPTFTHPRLLVNTGMWVCRMDRPWVDKVCFRQTDRVIKTKDGRHYAQTKPEDWDFSRQVRSMGGVLYATRRVTLEHEKPEWHNRHAWGTVQDDLDWQKNIEAFDSVCGQSAEVVKEQHANGDNSIGTVLHADAVA